MVERPFRSVADDDARLDIVTARERKNIPRAERAAEAFDRLPDEQRLLVPVPPQKAVRIDSAERRASRRWTFDRAPLHRLIIARRRRGLRYNELPRATAAGCVDN